MKTSTRKEIMKKIALYTIGIFIFLVVVLGIVAPRDFLVEKQLVINQPPTVVFEKIKYLKSHNDWNPWLKKDPMAKFEYSGVDGSVGFIVKWNGNSKVGAGEEEIKGLVEGKRMDLELRFKHPMEAVNQSYLILTPMYEGQTNVTWGMKGRVGFPKNVLYLLGNVPKQLGYDFDEGLRILKAMLEKKAENAL
jgi:hypothetical protein